MATLTNTIKKASKITGQAPVIKGQVHFYEYRGYTISFAQNGKADEACNFYTKRIGLKDDYSSDYFAGAFHDNIKQCFDFVDKMIESKSSKESVK